MVEGRFSTEHAQIITTTVDDLPDELAPEMAARAEAHLCELATQHRPGDLRRLARHLSEIIDPDAAEEAEARALQRLEAAAEAKATLSITSLGNGMSRVFSLVPDAVGERLRTLLEAYAQPRVAAALKADGRVRPRDRIMAEAFAQLLETIDPNALPAHGGDSTTVIVTITLDQLQNDLGLATMASADGATPITASQARRLACTCGIIPAVLNGPSEPLDLGRTKRLFSPAQRKALKLRDQRCRAEGCHRPRNLVRRPPPQPLVDGRKNRPGRRDPALCTPPPPSPRPNIRDHPPPQRRLPLSPQEMRAEIWYSTIRTGPAGQPGLYHEARRVLRPGGHLLDVLKWAKAPGLDGSAVWFALPSARSGTPRRCSWSERR